MHIFKDIMKELPAFQKLQEALKSGKFPCLMTGLSPIHKGQIAYSLAEENSPVLLITEDEITARRFESDINELAGENICVFYPAKDFNFSRIETVSREYEHKRLESLARITEKSARIMVASGEAVCQKTIPPSILKERSVVLETGEDILVSDLIKALVEAGYKHAEQVEGVAQFSHRGSIVDIFSVGSPLPYRVEFWGDTIDTIATFDIETQRRNDSIEKVSIFPALEVLFSSAEEFSDKINNVINGLKDKNSDRIKKYLYQDKELVESGIILSNLDKYLQLAYEKPACVFDYFNGGKVIVSEQTTLNDKLKGYYGQFNEDTKIFFEDGVLFKGCDDFVLSKGEFYSLIEKNPCCYLDTFMRTHQDIRFKELISVDALSASAWSGDGEQLIDEVSTFLAGKYQVLIMAGNEKSVPIIINDLREKGITASTFSENSKIVQKTVIVMAGSVSAGYEYPDIKQALITVSKHIHGSKRKLKKKKKGEEIHSITEITEGDLVVHSMHGIGRFSGISKIETSGVTKDYITIKYAGSDVLYVPVNQLDLVSRFVGPKEDSNVKLNKLNSAEWKKTRARVKSAVKDMAAELIALYAKRQNSKGFAFLEDDDFQNDFDSRFAYDETDDQLRCIREIKEDMQKPIPMDRLLCGDVGFGKTEVAFRGVMKCILSGKQCAILVPTTVLAWQHFQTALRRFEHFPLKIELLSRYRTPTQQKEILKQLKAGQIDLLIGTHRIVQKDVEFKDLGLAIIDEEQRFGVGHKEKFKEKFTGVDMLTLSATPIPRTLNMAMSGIRDMSVIEDPPQDRHPVQTYVIEDNFPVITQAISKELRRGGQVYYIHNRIETIDGCAFKLGQALPEARIGVAHGQISEKELSDIWRKLVEKEIDILVCTTLIETGVDVANCNTLVIEDADRLGLSQLYQLRGRVGRSNRRAFAYFTFKRGKVLTDIASKRLNAIREFTQFGSGFRIAMRDLEIRGAGSILSGRQHGHMEAVGYDMYIKLLNQAIAEQKGEPLPKNSEDCLVDVAINAFIPTNYIDSLTLRIDAYKKIASVVSKEDSMEILDELIDRYGDPPKAVMGLIDVALLRNKASALGITEISQRQDSILFFIKEPSMEQIKKLSATFKGKVMFNSTKKPYISVRMDKNEAASKLMDTVLETMQAQA